jgi:hypothetical protein
MWWRRIEAREWVTKEHGEASGSGTCVLCLHCGFMDAFLCQTYFPLSI